MIVVGSDSHTPVHGALGALAVALGNDSHAGTVLPYGKAWFKVPETVRVELDGTPQPGHHRARHRAVAGRRRSARAS